VVSTKVLAGSTYYLVGTLDGSTQRLYVNGTLIASRSLSGAASVSSNSLYLGSWNGSNGFLAGTIDEAAIYNKALPASAIATHYSAGT
jgi:hypothetical protein